MHKGVSEDEFGKYQGAAQKTASALLGSHGLHQGTLMIESTLFPFDNGKVGNGVLPRRWTSGVCWGAVLQVKVKSDAFTLSQVH